jgi:hypothetical protein
MASSGCKRMVSFCSAHVILLTSCSVMNWSRPCQGPDCRMTRTFRSTQLAMRELKGNVFTYDLSWIYFLNHHRPHLLLGSVCQVHEGCICNPDRVIVPVLVMPEDYFGILITFDRDIAWAPCFLRWDLPLLIGRCFIMAFSPGPCTCTNVIALEGPDLSTMTNP